MTLAFARPWALLLLLLVPLWILWLRRRPCVAASSAPRHERGRATDRDHHREHGASRRGSRRNELLNRLRRIDAEGDDAADFAETIGGAEIGLHVDARIDGREHTSMTADRREPLGAVERRSTGVGPLSALLCLLARGVLPTNHSGQYGAPGAPRVVAHQVVGEGDLEHDGVRGDPI